MHNAALAALGIPARYTRLHIRPDELTEALGLLHKAGFIGINCTIPHKPAVLSAVDIADEGAKRAGGVNTVVVGANGKLHGFSTDGPGFSRAVQESFGIELKHLRVLVLGAGGGAGRAIAMQCAAEQCPALTLLNRSLDKLEPILDDIAKIYPFDRVSSGDLSDLFLKIGLANSDLVVTSYGALLRLQWIGETRWRLVVIDEAQAIKNPDAKQSRAVKALKAEGRIALTGTPVENNLRDLWSIFDFLNPGLLGSSKAFASFVKKLSGRTPPSYAPLRKLVAPYILRRMKTDRSVIADLPDKTEVKAYCGLTRKQAALYQTTVDDFERRLKESSDDMGRRGLVLATLMRLKQICNHAAQGLGDAGTWSRGESGKFARLAEIAATIAERQEKLLVFTQFAEIIEPLCVELAEVFRRPGLALSGDTAVGKRKALVARFQEDEKTPFFVLSLKAGGSGLTLTAASHVVHFDRWWNPAVENQATDRAFRIGQKRNVLVHKFVCRGTIEERIDEMIESKRRMADEMLSGGGELNLTELDDRSLLDLVRLDLNAASKEA